MRRLKNVVIASVCGVGLLIGTMSVGNVSKAEDTWSSWSDTKPTNESEYDIEERIVYRYRDKTTTISPDSALSGWTQYDSETVWENWSSWQDSSVSSSSTREVNTRKVYRYRDKSTTTSTSSTLSGWTQYDSESVWGEWSRFEDTEVLASSTIQVETRQVGTGTYTYLDNPGNPYPIPTRNLISGRTGDDVRWAQKFLNEVRGAGLTFDGIYGSGTKSAVKSFQIDYGLTADGDIGDNTRAKILEVWRDVTKVENMKTQYRYKTLKTTYYFYKWSDWSSWSTTSPSTSSTREIEDKTQYQYRDSTTTYYFYRWKDWSSWLETKPATVSGREIEQKTQYRYKEKMKATTEESTTEAPDTTEKPNSAVTPGTTEKPNTAITPNTTEQPNATGTQSVTVTNGSKVKVAKVIYTVTDTQKATVTYTTTSNKKSESITIPETVKIKGKKYKVTKIADNAFKNNKKIKKVKIGSNITSIGKNAFKGCTNLKTLTLGKNVKTIGNSAFEGCKKLNKVTITKNIATIGSKAFYNCKELKTVTIESTKLNKVGKKAFSKIASNPKLQFKSSVPASKRAKYLKLLKR